MANVPNQKNLGYILSEGGSNMKNIISKEEEKSFGIIKEVQNLIRE